MKKNIIFVTGFIGSDRDGLARRLAQQNGMEYVSLDERIQEKDGRSIRRIVMTMGEHEVRNKEHEMLQEILTRDRLVVAVSDGILLDDQCLSLLEKGTVVIADGDLSPEDLWERAKKDPQPMYAFLSLGQEDEQYQKFLALYQERAPLYKKYQ